MSATISPKARAALLRLAGDGVHDMTRQMSDRLARARLIDYDLDRHEWVVTAAGLAALCGPDVTIRSVACPTCGVTVGCDADGRMNRHGNLDTGMCPAVTR